jgi:hypothetical protein
MIVGVAAVAGAAMYYLQVYGYYEPVSAVNEVSVTTVGGDVEPLLVSGFQGIDAVSSPLRYRACFDVPVSLGSLTETIEIVDDAVPLNGPGWFECYDAAEVGAALETGDAVAFMGQHDIHPGIDRIIAVMRDGRGYAWHQLNGTLEN